MPKDDHPLAKLETRAARYPECARASRTVRGAWSRAALRSASDVPFNWKKTTAEATSSAPA